LVIAQGAILQLCFFRSQLVLRWKTFMVHQEGASLKAGLYYPRGLGQVKWVIDSSDVAPVKEAQEAAESLLFQVHSRNCLC
jgi:hypothetical protein